MRRRLWLESEESEEPGSSEGDQGVDDSEDQPRTHDAEAWQQHEHEEDAGEQGAEIVEGKGAGDQVPKADTTSQHANDEWDFEAHEGALEHHDGVEHRQEGGGAGEGEKEQWRCEAANDCPPQARPR